MAEQKHIPNEYIEFRRNDNGGIIPIDTRTGKAIGEAGEAIMKKERASKVLEMARFVVKHGGNKKKAAEAYYKEHLQGTKSKTKINGQEIEVKYATPTSNDLSVGMGNRDKCYFVPFIPEVIETGEYLGSSNPYHEHNKSRFKAFHHFKKTINLPTIGEHSMIVDVGENQKGEYEYRFYIFRASVEAEYTQKEQERIQRIQTKKMGQDGFQSSSECDLYDPFTMKNITPFNFIVNIFFDDEGNEEPPQYDGVFAGLNRIRH